MNRGELAAQISADTGIQINKVETVIKSMIKILVNHLKVKGNFVKFVGLGKFYNYHKNSWKGRNPKTGEEMTHKGGLRLKFKVFESFYS